MRKCGWVRPTTPKASVHPSQRDIGWIAGFLEGEGSFESPTKRAGTAVVAAGQKQREPLERLVRLLGGSIRSHCTSGMWRWRICGPRARGVMLTLYTLMSPMRQQKIRAALI